MPRCGQRVERSAMRRIAPRSDAAPCSPIRAAGSARRSRCTSAFSPPLRIFAPHQPAARGTRTPSSTGVGLRDCAALSTSASTGAPLHGRRLRAPSGLPAPAHACAPPSRPYVQFPGSDASRPAPFGERLTRSSRRSTSRPRAAPAARAGCRVRRPPDPSAASPPSSRSARGDSRLSHTGSTLVVLHRRHDHFAGAPARLVEAADHRCGSSTRNVTCSSSASSTSILPPCFTAGASPRPGRRFASRGIRDHVPLSSFSR